MFMHKETFSSDISSSAQSLIEYRSEIAIARRNHCIIGASAQLSSVRFRSVSQTKTSRLVVLDRLTFLSHFMTYLSIIGFAFRFVKYVEGAVRALSFSTCDVTFIDHACNFSPVQSSLFFELSTWRIDALVTLVGVYSRHGGDESADIVSPWSFHWQTFWRVMSHSLIRRVFQTLHRLDEFAKQVLRLSERHTWFIGRRRRRVIPQKLANDPDLTIELLYH